MIPTILNITILNDTEFLVSTIFHEPFILTTDASRAGAQLVEWNTPQIRSPQIVDRLIFHWVFELYKPRWVYRIPPEEGAYLTFLDYRNQTLYPLYITLL